jgi:hypothetical protein
MAEADHDQHGVGGALAQGLGGGGGGLRRTHWF